MSLMRCIQLGKNRGQGWIVIQLGGTQLSMEGLFLLMQGLPLIVGGAVTLALERLELCLEARLLRLESPIGGENRVVGLHQLGLLGCRQDGIMVMMPSSSRAGRGCGGRVRRLGETRRDTCGSQREGHEGHALDG